MASGVSQCVEQMFGGVVDIVMGKYHCSIDSPTVRGFQNGGHRTCVRAVNEEGRVQVLQRGEQVPCEVLGDRGCSGAGSCENEVRAGEGGQEGTEGVNVFGVPGFWVGGENEIQVVCLGVVRESCRRGGGVGEWAVLVGEED